MRKAFIAIAAAAVLLQASAWAKPLTKDEAVAQEAVRRMNEATASKGT